MNETKKPKVICIVGPTASGKTSLGVKVAKLLNGEIVSADSMQIYKRLSVGTAKPTTQEMQGIKHHMIDIVDIDKEHVSYSVAEFKKNAEKCIDEIITKGKVPIIVGGTGLYVDSLLKNIEFKDEERDQELINELNKLAKEQGNNAVYNILKEMDSEAAKAIHPNNLKRVIRAIEICKIHNSKKTILDKEAIGNESKYRYIVFGIDFDRNILYNRINQRVDIMLENGIIEEARYVKELGLKPDSTVMQAIGYKEFWDYLDEKETLKEAADKLKQATRNYAKRQMTWFKNRSKAIWLDAIKGTNYMAEEIKGVYLEDEEKPKY